MFELKRILAPLNGSSFAEKALPLATTLAQKHQSQIVLLRVLRFFLLARCGYQEIFPGEAIEDRGPTYQEAEHYLQAWQRELGEQGFDVPIWLRGASPNQHIADVITSQEVDLIVMATHGRGGLARWLSGSIADEVVRGSHCPVLLVRPDEEDETKHRGKLVTDDWYQFQSTGYDQFLGPVLPEYEGHFDVSPKYGEFL